MQKTFILAAVVATVAMLSACEKPQDTIVIPAPDTVAVPLPMPAQESTTVIVVEPEKEAEPMPANPADTPAK